MIIIEINNAVQASITQKFTKNIVERVLEKLGLKKAEISIALVDKKTIRKLNREYRGIDKVTDVLSFNYLSTPNNQSFLSKGVRPVRADRGLSSLNSIKGEIVICYPQVKKQALLLRKQQGQAQKQTRSIQEEIKVLLIHGLLHLAGYDHEKMKEV